MVFSYLAPFKQEALHWNRIEWLVFLQNLDNLQRRIFSGYYGIN
jgi:hypothetical protein